jgi:hypothetical protein
MRISLYDMFCTDTLRHRETAQHVINEISKMPISDDIILDFKNIAFASRSFCHELLSDLKYRPNVKLENMNQNVKAMMKAIDKPKISFRIPIEA